MVKLWCLHCLVATPLTGMVGSGPVGSYNTPTIRHTKPTGKPTGVATLRTVEMDTNIKQL